jgi:osmoprotectant transport system substrate-binding protein
MNTPARRSPSPSVRSVRRLVTLTVATFVLVAIGFAGPAGAQAKSMTIGSKDFAGAQVVSQAYGQALEAKGYDVSFKDNLGPTEITYAALENGDLDAYGDYMGTLLTYLGGAATPNTDETYKMIQDKLKGTDIYVAKPAPAIDKNGFYVTKATAKKYKLKTMTDLAKVSSKLTFGGPPECEERPLCLGPAATPGGVSSQSLYGFKFKDVAKLDAGGPLTVQALEDGDADVVELFTGSSVIPKDAVLLVDDKKLQPADNVVLVMRKDKATPAALKIIDGVSAKMTTAAYNKMSLAISEDKEDPADAASEFLKSNKLT